MSYDVYLVGVGGQGVLTMGEILAEAARRRGVPVNFYPTKGMAQRGGFVKAQIRLGRATVGPNIPDKGADLVIAMEVSEALRAVRFVKPGGEFVLYEHRWLPTAVMLGKADYPELQQVREQIEKAGANVYCVEDDLPVHEGVPVPANIYLLGAVMGHTRLRDVLDVSTVRRIVETRWRRGVERNVAAFQSGLDVHID